MNDCSYITTMCRKGWFPSGKRDLRRLFKAALWLLVPCLPGILLPGCEELPVEVVYRSLEGASGVFISCEGNYMYGNGSLSFYDREKGEVYNQLFFARNHAPLGDVPQSLFCDGKSLFIVVNNSGKVVALDPESLAFKGAVTGLTSPRYLHQVDDTTLWVSDLHAGGITVFHPGSLRKKGFIPLPGGPAGAAGHPTEQFAHVGNDIFVTCWSYDNKVMVLDAVTATVVDSLTVPAQPGRIVADGRSRLWVLTGGSYGGAEGGAEEPALVRIDPTTRTVEQIFRWNAGSDKPGDLHLSPGGDSLYILAGDLYKMSVLDRKFPLLPHIRGGHRTYYNAGIDPRTGEIYLADAIDYAQNGMVYRFTPGGIPADSFRVGINPGDFLFR